MAATILYVGNDSCHRIPVMEMKGILVFRTQCSVGGLHTSFAGGDLFSAVTFHNDVVPPSREVVSTARELSRAPLILFQNPVVDCDARAFDVVIPVPAPPDEWSTTLERVIRESRELHEYSQRLRDGCAAVRAWSRSLRETSARNRVSPIDYDALFRGEADGKSDDEGDGS